MNTRTSQLIRREVAPTMREYCKTVVGTTFDEFLMSGMREYFAGGRQPTHGAYSVVTGLGMHWETQHPGCADFVINEDAATALQTLIRRYPILGNDGPFEGLMSALREGFAWGKYLRCGAKDYEVSPGLTQRLVETEIRGVNGDYLRLPFPAFALRLDPERFDGFVEALVVEQRVPEPWYGTQGGSGLPVTADTRYFAFLLSRKPIKRDPRHFYSSAPGRIVMLRIDPETDLTTYLTEKLAGVDDESARVVKFVLNLVLYLSWPDTGDEPQERVNAEWAALKSRLAQLNGYKKERAKERLKEIDPDRRIYIGAKVPFLTGGPATRGTGDKLLVRTLVSGHWKQQPCGEGRRERKLIRIEPYWKGPVDGPLSNPLRRVS